MSRTRLSLMLLAAVGAPWMRIAVARAETEAPDSAAALPYVRQMQSDLRNLVVAQESYFADHIAYAPSILALSETGWIGIAVHQDAPGYVCGVYVGMEDGLAPLRDAADEGEVTCRGPDGKPYR